jgi:hypothetical protein
MTDLKLVASDKPTEPVATVKIVLSDREPIAIVDADWPIVATLAPTDIVCRGSELFIRAHKDGRKLVYGWQLAKTYLDDGPLYAGHIVKANEDATRTAELLCIELRVTHSYVKQLGDSCPPILR